jgi:hypothetical protein
MKPRMCDRDGAEDVDLRMRDSMIGVAKVALLVLDLTRKVYSMRHETLTLTLDTKLGLR